MLNQLVYCSLSNNQLKSLPKEIGLLENLTELLVTDNMLKLIPSEIGCLNLRQLVLDDCPLLQSTPLFPDPERVCSLKELAARCIVRNSMDVKSRQLLPTLESYLGAFSVCSSCGGMSLTSPSIKSYAYISLPYICFHVGPFYENYVSRIRLVMRNDFLVPYESKLCVSHWSNEDDRIRFLFSSYPTTCRIPPAKQHPTSKPLYSNRFGREKASLQDTQQHIFLKRSASLTIIDTPKRDRNLSIALTRMTLLRGVSSSSLSMGH
jgi:Leucine-rich repeat (LRR) protein